MSDLEELRDAYIEHTLGHKPCTSLDDWAGERFDAILDQHDRKLKAEAWREGWYRGYIDRPKSRVVNGYVEIDPTPNPYRENGGAE